MKHREPPTLLLTVPEAAEAIRLSENTLRVWVREGIVPSLRWGPTSHPLIYIRDLEQFVADRVSAPASAPSSSVPAAGSHGGADGAAAMSTRPAAEGEAAARRPERASASRRRSTSTTQNDPALATRGRPNNRGRRVAAGEA